MEDIILVGYGGHGKSVADTIERQGLYNIIGYTDVSEHKCKYEYLGTDDVLKDYFINGIKNAFICLGYLGKGDIREIIYKKIKEIGFCLPIISDPSAIISESADIEEGVFIGKGAIVNAEAKIGRLAIINTKSLVEHECRVGEFTHVAVGAVLCGQVEIGKAVLVGANATVIQCRKVSDRSIVPAGTVIR